VTLSLSVVIPVYNERNEDLQATLSALGAGLRASSWDDPEVVIVDDGSEPPVVAPVVAGARTVVLRQLNQGRFAARRAGLERATGEYVLLLDSRVTLDPHGLSWVAARVAEGASAWNGHCLMANPESPFARFWNVLTYSAFSDYLDAPRTTSFTLAEYDRFPKGTGHFLAPRSWLLEAIAGFRSQYDDLRFSSDDTHMLRAIAARDRIHISPHFASVYRNRDALIPFLRHAIHRGTTFFDGFFRPHTRFFPVVALSFPASATGVVLAARRPRLALASALTIAAAGAGFARRRHRPAAETAWFGVLVVPFSAAFSAGIWRGAWLAVKARLNA
jgi:glycosyltransferase involved in cell wall biosynthesis